MKTLSEIQKEVGEWARANFGEQESKAVALDVEVVDRETDETEIIQVPLKLGSLAPLMGIVEEMGELMEAICCDDKEEQKDAIGDIGIYLCDYAEREGFVLSDALRLTSGCSDLPVDSLVIAVGKLNHVTLKRHQGIRGYDDDAKYKDERMRCVAFILCTLFIFSSRTFDDTEYMQILNDTWEGVVKKRDWKTNKVEGVGE